MDKYETTAKYNIAETCAASISINDLQDLSEDRNSTQLWDLSTKLTYGTIRGSLPLRTNLANLYSSKAPKRFEPSDIIIAPGAIAANMMLYHGLLSKGDHVICHYPTYQQLYEIPTSLGAEVSFWKAGESRKWQLDIEDLNPLIRPNTKMIIINNPHNPTGAVLPKSLLEALVTLASEHGIIIHSDEVYRPLFHSISPASDLFPPSLLSFPYARTIVTGSMSKAYSLAGIRVGWLASRSPEILEACAQARDYTTISVSQIDDAVAAFALGPSTIHALLARNIQLAKRNLGILEEWIESHRWACEWVRPVAGTIAFVKFSKMGKEIDDVVFCERLMEACGVMLCPGSRCFGNDADFKGYVRFGFCCETKVLEDGLANMAEFMKASYDGIPLVEKEKVKGLYF